MLSLRNRLGAVKTLAEGGVIAYPTESVFGFGCDPQCPQAIERLLQYKRRARHKGLILVAANQAQLAPWVFGLPAEQRQRLEQTWPGPVTWLVPDPNNWIPDAIKGQYSSVALRVSAHPVVQALCLAWGGPIVSTSANISGRPPFKSEYSLLRAVRGSQLSADYVVSGATQGRRNPTEIRDLLSGDIIRAG